MSRLSVIFLILIVIISISLQLWAASCQSFWEDETFTVYLASRGQSENVKVGDPSHPPLYIFLAIYWGKIFGYQELGLRFLSILFSEFTLFLTFLLAKDLLGKRTGLIAVTLLAFSPLFLMFGFNARYYSMAAMLALLTVYSMQRYLANGRPWYLAIYILGSVLFLYTLYAALVVIGICNIWWFLDWWRKEKRSGSSLITWILAQLLILVAYYPGLQLLSSFLGELSHEAAISNGLVDFIKRLAYIGYVFGLGETLSPLNPLAWLGGLLILGSGIYAILSQLRNRHIWLPVALFITIVFIGELISGATTEIDPLVSATWQNLPSRALCALPFLMVWVGAGIAAMRPRWMVLSGALILIVYFAGIYNFFTGAQYLRPIFSVSWHTIFREIREQAQPGAVVVCGEGDVACGHYSNRYGFGRLSLYNWQNQTSDETPEIWWIDINLSRADPTKEQEKAIIDQLTREYAAASKTGYGKQDVSLRQLKRRYFGLDDYEYRVVVHRFFNP